MEQTFVELLYPDTPFCATCVRRNLAKRIDVELNVSARPLCSSSMSHVDNCRKLDALTSNVIS